jgi:acyl carrier protein
MPSELDAVTIELCDYVRGQLIRDGAEEFDAARPLRQFGLDSFALIELLLYSESHFGVRLADSELTPENLGSIDAFARCICRKREA